MEELLYDLHNLTHVSVCYNGGNGSILTITTLEAEYKIKTEISSESLGMKLSGIHPKDEKRFVKLTKDNDGHVISIDNSAPGLLYEYVKKGLGQEIVYGRIPKPNPKISCVAMETTRTSPEQVKKVLLEEKLI